MVDLTRSLSIQIDNLCQFLPQDKVVEFAAMTPVELLKSTQRAVASQQMIDMHEELKDLGRKHQHVQAQFVADSDSLANLEGRQRLQEGDVDRIREREHTVKRVHDLEFSRPFAKYREMRGTVDGAKQRWKEAKDELQRLEAEVEPAMRRVNAKQQYMEQTQLVVTDTKQLINNAERRADSIDRRFSDLHDKHNQLVTSAEAEKKSGQKHREEVLRVEHAIKTLERQMEQPPAEMDAAAYNERLREKRRAIQSCKEQINELKEKQTETTERGREKQRRIGQARRDLEQLESQTGKQSSKLQNASVEVARLWAWVQQNPSHFKKHVFGPPIVECSIKDVRYIDQIESLFQRTQMLSFTVQTKQDFKTLSDQGSRMRLSEVNIKTMSAGLDNFPRPFGPEEMRRYGFDGWAIDYLNGPELVLSMLCADMQIHRTGVTIRDTTSQQYEMLQHSDISAWVTSKSSYRITRRREYGPDATSTQVRPTRRANVWTDQPVDLTAKRELQENIAGWEEEVAGFEAENKETQGRILTYREKIQNFMAEEKEISDEKSTLQKALSDFKALPTRLAAQQGKIAKAHEAMAVVKERIRDISNQLDDVAIQRARVALEFADAVEVLRIAHSSLHESEIMLIEATSDFETLRDHNISIRDTLEAQRREVTTTGQELEALKNEGQRLVNECRETLAEHGEVFQTFVQTLSKLSPEQLEAEIDSEKARLELMHEGGNSSVIRDYEKRQRQIDNLAARLEELNNGRTELADHIARIHGQWEPELDSLVGKISSSFSHNMAQMGCAGEVGVHKDDDFDQWAILIRVKFRYVFHPSPPVPTPIYSFATLTLSLRKTEKTNPSPRSTRTANPAANAPSAQSSTSCPSNRSRARPSASSTRSTRAWIPATSGSCTGAWWGLRVGLLPARGPSPTTPRESRVMRVQAEEEVANTSSSRRSCCRT